MNESQKELAAKAIWPLLALNFFMADMQAGVGPFVGVFLLAHGWASGPIGTVMLHFEGTVTRFSNLIMDDHLPAHH